MIKKFKKRGIKTFNGFLESKNLKKGIASICLGGGEALAVAIERE